MRGRSARIDWSPQEAIESPVPKKPKAKRTAAKIDPKYLAAGRELRDRYLEQFNSGLVLGAGKYDVARQLQGPPAAPPQIISEKLLPAA